VKYTKDDVIRALLTLVPCAFNCGAMTVMALATKHEEYRTTDAEGAMELAQKLFDESPPKEYLDGIGRRIEEIESNVPEEATDED